MINNHFDTIIRHIAKLPGLGPRSAQRLLFHLLSDTEHHLIPLITLLQDLHDNAHSCPRCHNLSFTSASENLCPLCQDPQRDTSLLCIVENVPDLWAMENAGEYRGLYYVLGGVLSTLEGIGPHDTHLPQLLNLLPLYPQLKEIIIATSMTANGQTTAHYIAHLLKNHNLNLSRIAPGVPMGGELDYLDSGTLNAALASRKPFSLTPVK